MSSTAMRYLVLRVSNVDRREVIEELTTVLASKGHVWFGKYGQPITPVSTAQHERTRVVILQPSKSSSSYLVKTFKLTAYSRHAPMDDAYPAYYSEVWSRIKTWLRLERAPAHEQVGIEDLTVSSSGSPLKQSLRSSSRSHFVCELKPSIG